MSFAVRARAMPVLAALLFVPSVAVADTFAPWASPHFWLITLLLGVLEGAILARLFGLTLARCVGLMIPANFLTTLVGLGFIMSLPSFDLNRELGAALVLVATTYGVTLLLEWPFVAACVRGSPGWLRRSVKGSLVAQTASYVVLVVAGIVAPIVLPTRSASDAAIVGAMKSDLRNLVTAQESYFADHGTYAPAMAGLADTIPGLGFDGASSGNLIEIVQASATGWSATIRRDPPDDPEAIDRGFGTTKTCGIFVGSAAPLMAGQEDGVPKCR